MNLEITFNGNDVSFNVDCVVEDDEELNADVDFPIDELSILNVSNKRLVHIPGSITRLTNLEELHLEKNHLTSLPDIGKLPNLEFLDLHDNLLTTCPSMRRLTNLRELNLSNNQITSIPRTIENLTNLEDLDVSNNLIQSIPASIRELNLLELNLSNNPITHIPATITNLRLRVCILPDNILLVPMQDEYHFTNRVVLNEVRRVFDIRRYNDLMEEKMENQNKIARRATRTYAKAATEYYTRRAKTAKNRLFSNKKHIAHLKGFVKDIDIPEINPPSSKVIAKNELVTHITGMLGNRYIPKTTNDVIR